MSIRAHIITDIHGNIVVQMRGGLDYDTSIPLRKELKVLLNANPYSKVTVDMEMVEFVGSSGIGQFVDTICSINSENDSARLTLSNVKNEFLRVFKLYAQGNSQDIEKYIESFDMENDHTSDLNILHGGKKRTFQN
ncbi:MAG: anti-sigma factor antagonist [Bacteriovoracaceae bacterium]|nr:anti-sigma factor antagonist [Bacteriovoracaceae bacterium]